MVRLPVSKSQREKGARGEREFAELLREYGFDARRDGRLDDDLDHDVPGVHIEVKRRNTLALPSWTRQAEQDAGGRVPVVAYRGDRDPWRVSMPAAFFLELLADRRERG